MTSASAPLFAARSIHVWRGERHLLRGVSFELTAGQLLQLAGPNGVGKTTLLRAVCGLLPVESGEFLWRGRSTDKLRDEFHAELAYLAHTNALKADLTAHENVHFDLGLRQTMNKASIVEQLDALAIGRCVDLPARVLSAGQKRRTALSRVLLSKATLWVLDEPTTNLDTSGIALLEQQMIAHLRTGGAILAAAHHGLLVGHSAARTLELAP